MDIYLYLFVKGIVLDIESKYEVKDVIFFVLDFQRGLYKNGG